MDELKRTDPEIFDLIKSEERYEIDSVRLIPSENYASKAVLEASGSVLQNKYSEGYPGKRYYRVNATSIRSRRSQSSARKNCSASSTPMSSPTRDRRPTSQCTAGCSSRARRLWAWRFRTAVI